MHLEFDVLEAALPEIRRSPREEGTVMMIVRRPGVDLREILDECHLDVTVGLAGDSWQVRGVPDPERQLTVMNSRVVGLLSGDRERWPLAGDQLYVDLDLGEENLPAGTQLAIGEAVIEITAAPHRGCKKFAGRYGLDALRFVNSAVGYAMKLRGVNARVVSGGMVRQGASVKVVHRSVTAP